MPSSGLNLNLDKENRNSKYIEICHCVTPLIYIHCIHKHKTELVFKQDDHVIENMLKTL